MSRATLILRDPTQAKRVLSMALWPRLEQAWQDGQAVECEVKLHKDAKSDRQRRYLHGVVLTAIAQQARPGGRSYPMPVWKEYARTLFLGSEMHTVTDPMTGKERRRLERISTESLNVAEYSDYIDRVSAWAADELGVTIPVQFEEWERRQVDMDTGEIVGGVIG